MGVSPFPFFICNMYRIKEIQEALRNLVGWEPSISPSIQIDNSLTKSESGLYYQNAHPLMTLKNIKSIMPDDFSMIYPEWNKIMTYSSGSKVRHNDSVYQAVKTNRNTEPRTGAFNNDFNNDFEIGWEEYNPLSDYLRRLVDNGIAMMVQTFVQMKGLDKQTKNLLDRQAFFEGSGRIKNVVPNKGRLVGFELTATRSMGVTMVANKIGLQMTGGTGIVRVYVFHSSQNEPIKTYDLDFTKTNGGFQWFDLTDCFMPYIGRDNNAGGSWYICYNQNDLPQGMQAVNMVKDWSTEPCGTCNPGSIEAWRKLMQYVRISPFVADAPATFKQFPEWWGEEMGIVYTNTHNYGMNIELSVECDLTDFIITQRRLFASVLQRQVAVIALRTMAMNPDVRVNRNQSNVSKSDILYEIDGNPEGLRPSGLGYELKKAYESLSLDTKGIDRVCLTCGNKGVRYTHV